MQTVQVLEHRSLHHSMAGMLIYAGFYDYKHPQHTICNTAVHTSNQHIRKACAHIAAWHCERKEKSTTACSPATAWVHLQYAQAPHQHPQCSQLHAPACKQAVGTLAAYTVIISGPLHACCLMAATPLAGSVHACRESSQAGLLHQLVSQCMHCTGLYLRLQSRYEAACTSATACTMNLTYR